MLEVRTEVGYLDMQLYDGKPLPRLMKRLTHTLPNIAADYSARWASTSAALSDHFVQLRKPNNSRVGTE